MSNHESGSPHLGSESGSYPMEIRDLSMGGNPSEMFLISNLGELVGSFNLRIHIETNIEI